MTFWIDLEKERFKFSAAHFTLFGADTAERLHGHNYQVFCSIGFAQISPETGLAAPFASLKQTIEKTCAKLDERVLIPQNSPFLSVKAELEQIEITFGRKHYSLPSEDVVLLPIVNTSSEEFARYIFGELKTAWADTVSPKSLRVGVRETSGQMVFFEERL